MKNKLWVVVILLILMFVPSDVKVASIISTSMSTSTEQEVGTSFYLPISVNFSGIGDMVGSDMSGIYMVALVLDFDDSVLEIDQFYSDFFDTEIYTDGDQYYVLSIADSDSTENKCADQFLACSSTYVMNIRFHIKNNSKESVDIKVKEAAAIAFKVDTTLESYTVDNMQELEYMQELVCNVKIKKTEEEIVEVPSNNVVVEESVPKIEDSVIEESKKNANIPSNSNPSPSPSMNLPATNDNSNNTDDNNSDHIKSSNANLASILIENYEIDFKKDQLNYEVTVDDDITSLKIKATPEDENATYEVIGANHLKDEVIINVKAENGEELTYTIKILRNINTKEDNTLNKVNQVIVIIIGVIVLIVFICLLISHHNKKKLDKLLDQM